MNDLEKQCLAEAYANSWNAVKGGKTITVDVLPHGWFSINYGYPQGSHKVRAEKLFKGVRVLTERICNGDAQIIKLAKQSVTA